MNNPNDTDVIERRVPEDSLKFTEILIAEDLYVTPIDKIVHHNQHYYPST